MRRRASFAFFLESGFLAVLLFGWNKVGPKLHFFATCMVCFGAHFSAVWIVVANSWMQTPAGYHLEASVEGATQILPAGYVVGEAELGTVRAVVDNFWGMVFNPSSVDRLIHVILGAWMAGAFLVVSISAFYLLRRRHLEFAKASMKVGLAFAAVATLAQMISGDATAKGVTVNQPVKLAAMEGLFETTPYAPLHLFGWVDEEKRETFGPAVPGLLSVLAHRDPAAPVTGLNDLPPDSFLKAWHPDANPSEYSELRESYWPPVQATFQLFHLMVGIGVALFLIVVIAGLKVVRGTLFLAETPFQRGFLWVLVFSVLGPQIANQAGWFTAEIGRQPWIVYEILKTSDGLSKVVTAGHVLGSLIMFALIYALLFAAFPDVYATVFSGFYIPFMLLLAALIFRAVAIEFRSKEPWAWWRKMWDVGFAAGSIVSSLLIGVAMGNLVRGVPLDADGEFAGTFIGMLNPYSLFLGITTVALFAMHGAIFLVMKNDGEVQAMVRGWVPRLIGTFIACYMIFNMLTLVYCPHVLDVIRDRPWIMPVAFVGVLLVLNIPREIHKGRDFNAFLSSCAGMATMMFVFGLTYFPYMVYSLPNPENSLTIYNASSTQKTLGIMLIIAIIGVPLVLAYTACIYYIFRGKTRLTSHSY